MYLFSHQDTKPALERLTLVIIYCYCFFNNFISSTKFAIPGLGQGHEEKTYQFSLPQSTLRAQSF